MIGRLDSTVLDCPDPVALAAFYSDVLGLPVTRTDDDWVEIRGAGGAGLAFQLAPDLVSPTWPDPAVPQQFHLDIEVDDITVAHEQILAAGARYLLDGEGNFRVYADPAGHPFCLVYAREELSG